MQYRYGFRTDIGCKRKQNQDSGAAVPDLGLFMVADGMGGHKGGETASSTAVEVITSFVKEGQQDPNWTSAHLLTEAFKAANQAIYHQSVEIPELQGMGTTTTALLFQDQSLTIGHVGDSRCYFFRPRAGWQATRDHSLVQEKLRAGLISREEVKSDRMKNVITRSVGFEREVNVEIYKMDVQVGDAFLVCSDGLSGMIEDKEISDIIQKRLFEDGNPQLAVEDLISAAKDHGGDDNVTAVLVQVL